MGANESFSLVIECHVSASHWSARLCISLVSRVLAPPITVILHFSAFCLHVMPSIFISLQLKFLSSSVEPAPHKTKMSSSIRKTTTFTRKTTSHEEDDFLRGRRLHEEDDSN